MEFLARLEETLENLSKKGCSVIICGDFNINIFKKSNLTAAYFDFVNSNGFELLNSDPPRISTSMDSCIDYFITKNVEGQNKTLKDESVSDHYPVSLGIVAKHRSFKPSLSFRDISFTKFRMKSEMFLFYTESSIAWNWIKGWNEYMLQFLPTVCLVGFWSLCSYESLLSQIKSEA